MNVNSSLVSVFCAIYLITFMMINILTDAFVETINRWNIFHLVLNFSNIQTKHNNSENRRLIMTQYALLWQSSIYFKYFDVNRIQIRSNSSSIRKKLIHIARIDNDNQNIHKSRISVYNKFLYFFCNVNKAKGERQYAEIKLHMLWVCCCCLMICVDCCASQIFAIS